MTDISVIIPHMNHSEFLKRCITSLLAQEDAPNFEIIVVDNGSNVVPHEVCEMDPRVRLLEQPLPGPGPARNLGASSAKAPVLAFIDADCMAHPHWLGRIADWFAAHPDHAVIGGDVHIAREAADGRASLIEAFEDVYSYRMREFIEKQGFTGTGNLAMRAEVMARVGPFGGINIAEDRDWGQRATAAGFSTYYVDKMIVYHPARKNFVELREKWARHVAHDCAELRRAGAWRARWLLRAAMIAVSPLAEIPYIAKSDRVSGLFERLSAFVGVTRIRLYRTRLMLAFLVRDPESVSGQWNRS